MANKVYPKAKQKFLQGQLNLSSGTVKAALVKSAYTYSDTHEFVSDLSTNVIGSSAAMSSKTFTDGVFKAANSTVTAAAAGNTGGSVVIYVDTGNTATSSLVAYLDTLTNLPVATNGGDINFTWDATNGIFTL